MPDYHSAYLFYDLLFLAVWIALFVLRHDLRVPMIIYSLLVAPLGPGSEAWYLRDYWRPLTITGTAIGIEDVLFAFAIGGIALAIYPTIAGLRFVRSNTLGPNPIIVGIFGAFLFASLFIGTNLFRINSVLMSVVAFLLTSAAIVLFRRDLLVPAMFSGIIFLALFVTIYQIMQRVYPGLLDVWCTGCNPSGVRSLGWNIEEYLWDSSWGVLGGILYPSVAGLATIPRAPSLSVAK
jgi:hypothetical protein